MIEVKFAKLPFREGSTMRYEARRSNIISSYLLGAYPPYVNMLVAHIEKLRAQNIALREEIERRR